MTNILHNKQHNWNICEMNKYRNNVTVEMVICCCFCGSKSHKNFTAKSFPYSNKHSKWTLWEGGIFFVYVGSWTSLRLPLIGMVYIHMWNREIKVFLLQELLFLGRAELMYIKGRYISIRELFVVLTILWHYRITKLRH